MRFHERENERTRPTPPQPDSAAGGSPLDELAQQGAALAAAGHAIINAALSGDSQAFLQATRQCGGQ